MSLHRLSSVTIGVPDVAATSARVSFLHQTAWEVDDQLWTPEAMEGARGLFNWGPPQPPSFIRPDDLAALMACAHSAQAS